MALKGLLIPTSSGWWLAETNAAAGDANDLNAKIGNCVGYQCHHVALVLIEDYHD